MTLAPGTQFGSAALPARQGLYDPAYEHDACGVAFVATLTGEPSHDIVAKGLEALHNLDHRGATGADPKTGDGAGILLQVPDAFLRAQTALEQPGFELTARGSVRRRQRLPADRRVGRHAAPGRRSSGSPTRRTSQVLGWRTVPTDDSSLSDVTRGNMPLFQQLFVAGKGQPLQGLALERRAYCLRRRAQHEAGVYFASLSCRTLVYKGMLTTEQLALVFPELVDDRMASALAVVHSRFSTNTFPAWELAHPFRMIAHNGEINTAKGNRNWMRAREALLKSDVIPGDLERLFPICTPDASDSASFDEVVELLHLAGRSLPHAMLMMIPEAWENNAVMDQRRKEFYAFHSCLMEPWDGPAGVVFTDGTQVGAVLDRNGLRPGRYWVTDDGLVVLASEAGVLDIPQEKVVEKGRLQPGRMFLADLRQHRLISNDEIKDSLAAAAPYGEWLLGGRLLLSDLPEREHVVHSHASVARRQQIFGYTEEDLRLILSPMAAKGAEPIGSMGTDTPVATLSDKPRLLFDYFSQLFAQVTNPPLDAIREELVTSLYNTIGPEWNLLDPGPASCRRVVLPFPVLDNDELTKIVKINRDGDLPGYATHVARGLYDVHGGAEALAGQVGRAVCGGVRGDRERRPDHRAVRPALDRRARADPDAAPDLGDPPSPGPGEDPDPGRSGGRGGRRPRGPPRRAADRLRRGRGEPVPRDRVASRTWLGHSVYVDIEPEKAVSERHQVARQGRAEGDDQDGHLDGRLVHRARRSSRRSVCRESSSTSTSPARRASSAASA